MNDEMNDEEFNCDKYVIPEHLQFIDDMEEAGLGHLLEHYHGRFYWSGPAVIVGSIQEALKNTKVPCNYDNMGLSYIVHPSKSMPIEQP